MAFPLFQHLLICDVQRGKKTRRLQMKMMTFVFDNSIKVAFSSLASSSLIFLSDCEHRAQTYIYPHFLCEMKRPVFFIGGDGSGGGGSGDGAVTIISFHLRADLVNAFDKCMVTHQQINTIHLSRSRGYNTSRSHLYTSLR